MSINVFKKLHPQKCKNINNLGSQLPGFLRKVAVILTAIYLCTTIMGCAPFYVNGAKIYDPDSKQNTVIYAAAGNTSTDANTGEEVAWYKTTSGIIGITVAAVIIIGVNLIIFSALNK